MPKCQSLPDAKKSVINRGWIKMMKTKAMALEKSRSCKKATRKTTCKISQECIIISDDDEQGNELPTRSVMGQLASIHGNLLYKRH
jgi:hypothetical protein